MVAAADGGPREHAKGQYNAATTVYTVAASDDLSAIAERFGAAVGQLETLNKLAADKIEVGQTLVVAAAPAQAADAPAAGKKPNVVMLMQDDTGWTDFGAYLGGAALGHPTPNVDQLAKEGMMFTSWYGQASCTAGRASFMTGRIPIRSALSIVVAPGDENTLRAETPTIAEHFKKHGYRTYFSGKWHLGDKPDSYPIEHGFDEMKNFAAYYAGVYTYNDTSEWFHPWFPSYNQEINDKYLEIVNLYEWEGEAGKPAKKGPLIDWDYLAELDVNQTKNAVEYIKAHANDDKPFFMDVNFMTAIPGEEK